MNHIFQQIVVLDSEMVVIKTKKKERAMIAAQVTIIDLFGNILLHTYARPPSPIVNFNTPYSGVLPSHLKNCPPFKIVREWVLKIIQNKIVVGHAIANDFHALKINHPTHLVIDTQKMCCIQATLKNSCPSLRKCAQTLLNREIQKQTHSSLEDAVTTADIFKMFLNTNELIRLLCWTHIYTF